jgi:ribosome-associated protein
MIFVPPNIRVEEHELLFKTARSGGPGGQHVNKAETRVQMRWNVGQSHGVPDAVKARFLARFRTRITEGGELIIDCDETRSQARNREICLERLKQMLTQVATPPKPRKKSKPSKSALKRRREHRQAHAAKKAARRKVDWDPQK